MSFRPFTSVQVEALPPYGRPLTVPEAPAGSALLCNLYRPTLKLISKERQGAKVTKRYAKQPQTPCQRVQEHPNTSQESQDRLAGLLATTDPISLQERLETLLKAFFELRTKLAGERDRAAGLVSGTAESGAGEMASLRSPIAPAPAPCANQIGLLHYDQKPPSNRPTQIP